MNLIPHTPLAQWNSDPENSAWLDKLLASRRGQLLLSVLGEMAKPSEDFNTIAMTGAEVIQKMAMNHCLSSGQTLCLQNLRMLALPPSGEAKPLPEPWEYPDTEPSEF
jgi:hypothetical protein